MKFKELQFKSLENGNELATVKFDNGYGADIVKITFHEDYTKYKIKPFEIVGDKKLTKPDMFDGYGGYPIVDQERVVILLKEVETTDSEESGNDDDDEINLEEE